MSNQTILLIDDDIDLCQSVNKLLTQHGFSVLIKNDSQNFEAFFKQHTINLVLLDIMLPGGRDGIAVCREIRTIADVPIIMLTGVEDGVERIVSLEVGADNYITKPFNSRVLIAHINASLRRAERKLSNKNEDNMVRPQQEIYEFMNWKLNVTARSLLDPENHPIKITSAEFTLLHALLQRPQCVLSRDQLINSIKSNSDSFDRSIDILISRIRSKIEPNPKQPQVILTLRNAGYTLVCPVKHHRIQNDTWQKMVTS